jgi:Type I phosphodiesterase / nucleotide pyrophosphatase
MTPHDHHPEREFVPSTDADVAAVEAAVRADEVRRRAFSRRAFLAGAAAVPAGLWMDRALTGSAVPLRMAGGRGSGPQAACALPDAVLDRVVRGWDPQRSGQLLIVPQGWNYVSGAISHSTPWHYTQDVPLLWYGPGIIRAIGNVDRYVTVADIAPTVAKLVKFPFSAHDGHSMDEAIKDTHPTPKLVVVLVWDAGGNYVLNLHQRSWPHLKALMPHGTSFGNATVGSNPSNTAPIHVTIGTGAFPRTHGVVDNIIRFSDGRLGDPWSRGPGVIKVPTLADEYAKAKGASAKTVMFGTLTWHLGMVGKGAGFPGGRKHLVVLRSNTSSPSQAPRWELPDRLTDYYRFPYYVNSLPPLKDYWNQWADLVDGRDDGTWRGHSISAAEGGFATPARIPWQTRAIREVIEREHLGQHDAPDLLFINYKIIDEIGHEYFADSAEMADTIAVQDRFLQVLVDYLNNRLPGKWVLCLTADHGHTATPGRTGGSPLLESRIQSLVEGRFDADGDGHRLVQTVRPIWLQLSPAEMQDNGTKLSNVSSFVANLTASQVAKPGTFHTGSAKVFDAVFPGSILANLNCG